MWDLEAIVAGVVSEDIWPALAARHDALISLVGPPIFVAGIAMTVIAPSSETLLRWRSRGNTDQCLIIARVEARAVSGSVSIQLTGGAAVLVDTAGHRTYHLTMPPDSDGLTEVELIASGAGTIEIVSVTSYLLTVPAALRPATASGVLPAAPSAAGRPVASEHVARALGLPGFIARDRPHCVFSHGSREGGVVTPTHGRADASLWGAKGDAPGVPTTTLVGRGRVPQISTTGRRLIVDILFARSAATAVGEVRLEGLTPVAVGDIGWTTAVIDGPGAGGELRATIALVTTEDARYQTVQMWRSQEDP